MRRGHADDAVRGRRQGGAANLAYAAEPIIALLNLIGNALDAAAEVEEGCMRHDQVCLEVVDNGLGLKPEASARIFRGHYSNKSAAGTGLGLMVCHKIASEHDSRVEFDHAQGRGTIFCLSLPCATVHAESDTHAGDRPGQPGGALASGVNKELPMAKRILVVDDEMDLSTFVSKVLESRGYRVGVAGDGEQGLRQARVQTAAGHPERDDAQTKRPENVPRPQDLYYEFKDTRMLIISGLARKTFLHSQGVLDKFKKQSMPEPDDYIEKPPEPEEILVEVSRLIGD